MQGGGISFSSVDSVCSSFDEYKSNIQSTLDSIAENPNYQQAYKGFDQAVKTYVDNVCEQVKTGVIQRIEATVNALKQAREEYESQGGDTGEQL